MNVIDIPTLIHNLGGNDKIIPKLLDVFFLSARDCTKRLEEAIASHHLEQWQRTSHELKGAALSITAQRIANICSRGETASDLTNAPSLLRELETEITALKKELAAQALTA